jgi:hypothetical protein
VPRLAAAHVTLSPRSTASLALMLTGADSKGLNQWERKALQLSGERSELGFGISTVKDH